VASKGLSDELKGTFYAVIETPTRCAYHVALVSFTSKPEAPVRPVARQIADVIRSVCFDPGRQSSGTGGPMAMALNQRAWNCPGRATRPLMVDHGIRVRVKSHPAPTFTVL
jgi:hypothetical protein